MDLEYNAVKVLALQRFLEVATQLIDLEVMVLLFFNATRNLETLHPVRQQEALATEECFFSDDRSPSSFVFRVLVGCDNSLHELSSYLCHST